MGIRAGMITGNIHTFHADSSHLVVYTANLISRQMQTETHFQMCSVSAESLQVCTERRAGVMQKNKPPVESGFSCVAVDDRWRVTGRQEVVLDTIRLL